MSATRKRSGMSFRVKPSTVWTGRRNGRFGAEGVVFEALSEGAGGIGDWFFAAGSLVPAEVDGAPEIDGAAIAAGVWFCVVITAPGFPEGLIG